MSHLFISYANKDHPVAERLYEDLLAAGHRPWLAPRAIEPGSYWQTRISESLRRSRYCLVLLSRYALRHRGYVQAEVRAALDVLLSLPPGRRHLIPVRLEKCNPRDATVAALQWVDLFPSYEEGLARLLQSLPRPKRARPYFYAQHGVILPDDLARWPIQRQVKFITNTLWPALSDRAHKAYEYVQDDDVYAARQEYAQILLLNVARVRGFLTACYEFLGGLRERSPNISLQPERFARG